MNIYIISVALSYKRILYIKVTHINCLASSLSIFISKTLVFNSSVLFTCPFINKKPYYNSSLFLNRNIDLTSIGL